MAVAVGQRDEIALGIDHHLLDLARRSSRAGGAADATCRCPNCPEPAGGWRAVLPDRLRWGRRSGPTPMSTRTVIAIVHGRSRKLAAKLARRPRPINRASVTDRASTSP